MSQYVSIEFARKAIQSQECDTLHLFDTGRDHVLFRFKGTPKKLCDDLSEAYENIGGIFRCEAFKSRKDATGRERVGAKSVESDRMVWLLGARDYRDDDVRSLRRHKRDRDDDGDDDSEEEEEEEEEQGPAPMTEFQQKMLEMFAPLAQQLLPKLMGIPGAAPVNGAQPVAGAPTVNAFVDGSNAAPPKGPPPGQGEAAVLARAIARMKKANPAQFAEITAQLLSAYGDPQ